MDAIIVDKSRNKRIVTRMGASFALNINVKNNNASLYDFTGHTVTFEIFRGPSDRSAEMILATGAGLTLSAGLITLSKTAAQMLALRLDKYLYYLWVTFPDGSKKLWLNGEFKINKEEFDAPISSDEAIIIQNASDSITLTVETGAFNLSGLSVLQLQELAQLLSPYLV